MVCDTDILHGVTDALVSALVLLRHGVSNGTDVINNQRGKAFALVSADCNNDSAKARRLLVSLLCIVELC